MSDSRHNTPTWKGRALAAEERAKELESELKKEREFHLHTAEKATERAEPDFRKTSALEQKLATAETREREAIVDCMKLSERVEKLTEENAMHREKSQQRGLEVKRLREALGIIEDVAPPGPGRHIYLDWELRQIAREALSKQERCKHDVHGEDCFECYPSGKAWQETQDE